MKVSRKHSCAYLSIVVCALLAVVIAGCSGCCGIPPGTPLTYVVFPKRTGAEGIVLDQHDQPVPNSPLRAFGGAQSWGWAVYLGGFESKFSADKHGRWKFYRRDTADMGIQALPPPGYGRFQWCSPSPDYIPNRIRYGDYVTNVVLRLWKLDPPPAGEVK